MYIYSKLFCLYCCKDCWQRVTTELQLIIIIIKIINVCPLLFTWSPLLFTCPTFHYISVPETHTTIYWISFGFMKNRCVESTGSWMHVCPLLPHLVTDFVEIWHNRSVHDAVEHLWVLCTFGMGTRQCCCCGLIWSYVHTWIVELFDSLKVKNALMTPLNYVADRCSSKGWWNLPAVNVMVSGCAGNWSWCIVRCFAGSLAWTSHKRWVTRWRA